MSKNNIRADRGEAEITHPISDEEMEFLLFIHENLPYMSSDLRQGWMNNPIAFRKILAKLAPDKIIPSVAGVHSKNTSHLRFLKSVTLAPTSGLNTIAQANAVFTGGVSSLFKAWGTDVPGEDTLETQAGVHEVSNGGNFRKLFGSLGDPRKLCLSQGQIIEFCRSHLGSLRQESFKMFSVFQVKGELFVSEIYNYNHELHGYLRRFDYDHFWRADIRYRLVVKQQKA